MSARPGSNCRSREKGLFEPLSACLSRGIQGELGPGGKDRAGNEEVVDGRGWRSRALVEKKTLMQWFFRITAMPTACWPTWRPGLAG